MGTRPNVLWMGDLEPYMDVNFVIQAYESLGHPVRDVRLINNKQTGMPAAYCFVEFKDAESAQKALFQLNSKIIPGSGNRVRFKLNHASYGREHLNTQEYSIYVGGLSEDVDDYAFYTCFVKKYPSVHSAKVVLDPSGRSRGYGFVRFRMEEERERALKEMQRFKGLGKTPITVSLAQAKRPWTGGTTSTPSSSTTTSDSNQRPPAWNQYPGYYDYNQWQNYNAYNYNYYGYGDQSQWGQWGDGYGGYNNDHYQQQQNSAATDTTTTTTEATSTSASGTETTSSTAAPGTAAAADQDDELQDPEMTVDVEKCNKEFMERSEELYQALEGSRWHPLDNVFSTISVQH